MWWNSDLLMRESKFLKNFVSKYQNTYMLIRGIGTTYIGEKTMARELVLQGGILQHVIILYRTELKVVRPESESMHICMMLNAHHSAQNQYKLQCYSSAACVPIRLGSAIMWWYVPPFFYERATKRLTILELRSRPIPYTKCILLSGSASCISWL